MRASPPSIVLSVYMWFGFADLVDMYFVGTLDSGLYFNPTNLVNKYLWVKFPPINKVKY